MDLGPFVAAAFPGVDARRAIGGRRRFPALITSERAWTIGWVR
jgi:hypothetical protein